MARAQSQPNTAGDPPRRKRLSLLDSYGAFSDAQLQDAAAKIRRLVDTRGIDEAPAGDQSAKKSADRGLGETTGETSGQSIGETIGEAYGTPYDSPIDQSVKSPHDSPDGSPHTKQRSSPNGSPLGSTDDQLVDISNTTEFSTHTSTSYVLTVNQALLYFCLERLQGAPTSLSRIARAVGVSQDTLKSCLQRLKEQKLIEYGGRVNCGGRFGFTARALPRSVQINSNRNALVKRLRQLDYDAMMLVESLAGNDGHLSRNNQAIQPPNDSLVHRMVHPMESPSCSSSFKKDLLLQDLQTHLILEGAFQDLNPQSLVPYLDQFGNLEALQTFLDMANACITATKTGNGKPIQNPQGFLFAQLKAGYINPPEGFKSRKVRAQEIHNQQLEAELATLRQLKERERELQFELFREKLAPEEFERLEREARAQVKPGLGISKERQIEVAKDEIVKQWFEWQGGA
jgi:DNA-binding Lrp family transcriptional regulator